MRENLSALQLAERTLVVLCLAFVLVLFSLRHSPDYRAALNEIDELNSVMPTVVTALQQREKEVFEESYFAQELRKAATADKAHRVNVSGLEYDAIDITYSDSMSLTQLRDVLVKIERMVAAPIVADDAASAAASAVIRVARNHDFTSIDVLDVLTENTSDPKKPVGVGGSATCSLFIGRVESTEMQVPGVDCQGRALSDSVTGNVTTTVERRLRRSRLVYSCPDDAYFGLPCPPGPRTSQALPKLSEPAIWDAVYPLSVSAAQHYLQERVAEEPQPGELELLGLHVDAGIAAYVLPAMALCVFAYALAILRNIRRLSASSRAGIDTFPDFMLYRHRLGRMLVFGALCLPVALGVLAILAVLDDSSIAIAISAGYFAVAATLCIAIIVELNRLTSGAFDPAGLLQKTR